MEEDLKPFETIGLCFSGGGYRATFFALGVIAYLDKIDFDGKSLLNRVEALSSVSGGTLLAAAYTKEVQDPNFTFVSFYKKFYNAFTPKDDRLLETAVDKLEDESLWKAHPHKKRSLINAFALTYADFDFFKGGLDIFEKPNSQGPSAFCFNATDFSFGLAFRFQNTGRFGNKPLYCAELNAIKGQVQIADVVASSSCFPMGFEPLLFPDDYIAEQTKPEYKALKRLEQFTDGVGVMDGGIVDNQGIGSMVNIDKAKKLDLIIINDVGSYKMEPWQPDTTKAGSKKSLKDTVLKILGHFGLNWTYWVTLVVGILLLILNSLQVFKGESWVSLYLVGGILTGIGLTLTVLGVGLAVVKSTVIDRLKLIFRKVVPEVLLDDVVSLDGLDVGTIKVLLTERMTSTVKMVSDIFLKQIRRLNYDLVYAKEALRNKVISSTVYELNGQETLYKKDDADAKIKPMPSKQLKRVALIASEAPTSLWWDENDVKNDRMDSLIACGQFTTCYNLIDYILKLEGKGKNTAATDALKKALIKDWKAFNKNPVFMV
ncbi:patatin-like phospholipase family protein [uncultured Arcticibacterium sp.]|uniref:patatin-like phospholipase family protein n=1 Tax=uncultured Arcticibacterium sp. TaxID=2173042 RepID=UPI0030FC28FC